MIPFEPSFHKAGHLCKCVCCLEDFDEADATLDAQLGGPICPECRRNTLWATAYLKKFAGADRPFEKADLTNENHKRFLDS
jgi:hypothetical protein